LGKLRTLSPVGLLVSTSRMDSSGRVHERIMLRELGWEPGTRLEMDALHGMIVIAAAFTSDHADDLAGHAAGQGVGHVVDHRGAIKLPAPLRRLCGIGQGPPLVLAAAVPDQVMVVHPSATVARLLAAHYIATIHTNPPDTDTVTP
jgi:hypothetical protein